MSQKYTSYSLWFFISLSLVFFVIRWFSTLDISLPHHETASFSGETEYIVPVKTKKEIIEEVIRKKIEKVQKKNTLKWLVVEWDSYFQNNELPLALKSYLEVFRKNKKDIVVLEKIWDTYAAMKRFKNAHTYYRELPLSEKIREKIIKNLLASIDIRNPLEREKFLQDIALFDLDQEQEFYYKTTFACLDDFHLCKITLWEYFTQKVEIEPNIMAPRVITYPPLIALKQAIENYENFQLDEVYYKDALIIGSYFQEKMYPVALLLGEKLVSEKPDYKAILKIIAESYFEIGNYEKAKEALTNYYKLDTSDPTILSMLWVIYSEEKDFVLSNIYFSKAIEGGVTPTLSARRNIVYNYFFLESSDGFLTALQDLIEKEPWVSQSDLRLAVYYHILYKDIITAKRYIQKGKKLFPSDAYFYGYAGLLHREEKNYAASQSELESGYKKDPHNPFVLLNFWILEKELWNESQAQLYFKKTIEESPFSEFALQAKQELTESESLKSSLKGIFQ
jgi:tetratricopeptide (TPR) repeat protein